MPRQVTLTHVKYGALTVTREPGQDAVLTAEYWLVNVDGAYPLQNVLVIPLDPINQSRLNQLTVFAANAVKAAEGVLDAP